MEKGWVFSFSFVYRMVVFFVCFWVKHVGAGLRQTVCLCSRRPGLIGLLRVEVEMRDSRCL